MPNHVTNIMTVSGPVDILSELQKVLFSKQKPDGKSSPGFPDRSIDFNRILPMPESLNIEAGSKTSWAYEWLSLPDHWSLSEDKVRKYSLISHLKNLLSNDINSEVYTVGQLKELAKTEGICQKLGLNQQYLEQIRFNIETYGSPTWYEWCNFHWGTKWNAYHQYLAVWTDTEISIAFDTAWSPPEPIFALIAASFPEVKMEVHYVDESGCFAGTFIASDGMLEDFPCDKEGIAHFTQEYLGWDPEEDYDE